jgi:hypothetical protein
MVARTWTAVHQKLGAFNDDGRSAPAAHLPVAIFREIEVGLSMDMIVLPTQWRKGAAAWVGVSV